MLSERLKSELTSETYRGYVFPMINRLRNTRDPNYTLACRFVLDLLRRLHQVPADRYGGFIGESDYLGCCFVFAGYRKDRDCFCEQGVDLWHPDELEPEPVIVPEDSTPKRSYFRQPKDFKMAQANDL